MDFNVENLKALAEKAYVPHALAAFGELGSKGITTLLNTVKLIYQRCPPESIKCTLTVLIGIDGVNAVTPATQHLGKLKKLETYAAVADFVLTCTAGSHTSVEISDDGTFYVLNVNSDFNIIDLAKRSIVYRFESRMERILAKDFNDPILKISPILMSNFATPTHKSLEVALDRYGSEFASETQCRILAPVWEGGVDGPRLVLVNKPEELMRDSLIQALQLMLRDTSVRPEQNTDEWKPVDIRIEWFGSAASALIEVKWLGRSTAKPKEDATEIKYTDYFPGRAQSGANQLADYLDREVRHANTRRPRGYLVVFDARRRNIKGANDLLRKEDAMFFSDTDLTYDPNHAELRDDFSEPYRFFMKPRASHFQTTAS